MSDLQFSYMDTVSGHKRSFAEGDECAAVRKAAWRLDGETAIITATNQAIYASLLSTRRWFVNPPTAGDYAWYIFLPPLDNPDYYDWRQKSISIINGGLTPDGGTTGMHFTIYGYGSSATILKPLSWTPVTNIVLEAGQSVEMTPQYCSISGRTSWYYYITLTTAVL
jgi:hypothetical protein